MKKLRAHHLFCGMLFSGHGYDQAFTENMQNVLERLNGGEELLLWEGADDLCGACPNRTENGGCALGTKDVSQRDLAALRVLGFRQGDVTDWSQVRNRLRAIGPNDFLSVCSHCRWAKEGLCSFQLLQERVK